MKKQIVPVAGSNPRADAIVVREMEKFKERLITSNAPSDHEIAQQLANASDCEYVVRDQYGVELLCAKPETK